MPLEGEPLIATATVAAETVDFAADWRAIARSESDGSAVSWNKGAQAGVPVPLEGDGPALVEGFAMVVVGGFRQVALIGRSPLWQCEEKEREDELQPRGWQRLRSRFLRRWFDGLG